MKENKMNYRSAYCSITEPSQFLRGNGLKIFFTFLLVLSIQFASAQIKVTGNVTDNNGIPLIGVNVVIIGTDQGTITNVKGNYSLNAAADAQLKFNYVGYNEVSLNVNGRTVINVQMAESTKDLEEVVVVGYGQVRKRDLTGSIASFGADKLKDRPYGNALQSLSGQVSGVQITQSQGAPGMAPSIKVRGASSINAGTTPLYVIDGIPLEDNTVRSGDGASSSSNMDFNRNPLNNINPNDIESIEVLKDASSAAIYGSRGANGVVIITTKQGKAGKTKIDASYEFGVSQVNRRIETMDAKEWMQFETAARNNTWATILKTNPTAVRGNNTKIPVEFSDPAWLERIGNGTDWQDVLFRTAYSHNVQLSASGGNEKSQFMVSGGYLNSEGVVDQNEYDRITLRSNMKHKISDKLNIGVNIGLTRTNDASFGTAGKSDAVSLSVQSAPIFPLYVETGSLGFKDPTSIWNTFAKYGFQLWHPYSLTREMTKKKLTNVTTANSFAEWNITKDLSFKTAMSANIEDSHYSSYWNEGQKWGYSGWVNATGNFITMQSFNWVWENTLNYNKTFNKDHVVSGLLGYTAQEQKYEYSNMTSGSFPNDMVKTLNAGKVTSGSTTEQEWSLLSYLARATYAYKDKYLASATLRADGCSRFGENNRWGYFPSASLGWRIKEESFMSNLTWVDNLKLRLSYGETGNNQIPNYGSVGLLGYSSYVSGANVVQGIYTNSFPDRSLKWEKTSQTNLGLDGTVLNQRVNFSLDVYYSNTRDLLLNVPIPALTGFQSTLTNIGKLENKGIEFSLSTKNLVGDFTWTTDFNISANRNKVLKLGANDAPILLNINDAISKTEVGQPIGNYFGYIFDGVIMSQAELDGKTYPVWPGSEPGDPKVRDVNGDNKIDSNDRTIIGNYQPDFSWGMTNTFGYKGVELSIMLTGVEGAEIMNQHARFLKSFNGDRNAYQYVTNYWKSDADPGNGKINKPRVTQNTVQSLSSSYWVEDGSFLRVKNIRLGYNLPSALVNKFKIGGAKLYVNMENVYVVSDYSNYDPEGSTYQAGVLVGFDYGAYPNPFVATAGITINL
ncbi:MAG TPA: TonB-dependent receptor [Paludibacter sp.]|nr:TonB-dependent receptor [Paludibacter sp.]